MTKNLYLINKVNELEEKVEKLEKVVDQLVETEINKHRKLEQWKNI